MLLLLTSIAVVSLIPMPSPAARATVAGTILAVGSVLSLAAAGGAVALAAAERFKWRRQEEEAEAEESASWPVVGGAERSPTEQQERLLLSPGGGDALEMPHAGNKQLLPLAPYAAAALRDLRLTEIEFATTTRLSIEAAGAKATTNAAVANPLGKTLHPDLLKELVSRRSDNSDEMKESTPVVCHLFFSDDTRGTATDDHDV